jgi:hypothetical protein
MTLQKLVAAAMGTLLVSCSAARHMPPAPTSPDSLSQFVLIIQERPDGQLIHSWQSAESFEISAYRLQWSDGRQARRVEPAAARQRDCDQENQDCYRECMRRPLPPGYESYESPRKRGGKSEFCRGECQQAYDDCLELERLRPREFTAADGAVDWLKRHRTTVLVGSVVVIAGVAFVVLSSGAGLIILAPVVLLASSEVQPAGFVLKGAR